MSETPADAPADDAATVESQAQAPADDAAEQVAEANEKPSEPVAEAEGEDADKGQSGSETLPPPATLDQLKAGWVPGVSVSFRNQKGDVVTYEHWTVLSATDEAVTIAYARADFHGNPVEPPKQETTPFAELDTHARFPASRSTRERFTESHPKLGELDGWLYTVQGSGEDPSGTVKRYWFNDAWPGPPVRQTVEVNGLLAYELAMLKREVAP